MEGILFVIRKQNPARDEQETSSKRIHFNILVFIQILETAFCRRAGPRAEAAIIISGSRNSIRLTDTGMSELRVKSSSICLKDNIGRFTCGLEIGKLWQLLLNLF